VKLRAIARLLEAFRQLPIAHRIDVRCAVIPQNPRSYEPMPRQHHRVPIGTLTSPRPNAAYALRIVSSMGCDT
jgi:hypothetical protein